MYTRKVSMDFHFHLKHIKKPCFALLGQDPHNQIDHCTRYMHPILIFYISKLNGHYQIVEQHA